MAEAKSQYREAVRHQLLLLDQLRGEGLTVAQVVRMVAAAQREAWDERRWTRFAAVMRKRVSRGRRAA
jgi:hypothetical protein